MDSVRLGVNNVLQLIKKVTVINQSTHMVSSITLDPHPIIKQAGMRRCATSNAAGPPFVVVYVSVCEQRVHTRGYQPLWVNQSTHMVSSITLDPHPIIKQAGMRRCATSNAAGPPFVVVYVSVCEQRVHTRGYQPLWVNQSTHMVSSITLDPHPIITQAGMGRCATSNAAQTLSIT